LSQGHILFTNKGKLNIELGWETIQKRADILGLNIFHKIYLNETRPLTKLDIEGKHKTRSKGGYLPYQNFGVDVEFKTLFFPHTSGTRNVHHKNLLDFKTFTNAEFKPAHFKHFLEEISSAIPFEPKLGLIGLT
jgi:hypothetical protein